MTGEENKKTPLPRQQPLAPIRETLLLWYDRHARDLPWRGEPDPYRIWLSEIMLQQTRVETVLPYYDRFLRDYPTLDALSAASEEEVLKRWEGLGYYARARHFLGAVREVLARYGGRVPPDPGEFKRLPGVGDYTAAAVLSIAYGLPLAAVDGNVRRVISRLFCLEGEEDKGAAEKEIKRRAGELLDTGRPGDFNQALMDLGASCCTPRHPSCGGCPLSSFCLAHHRGRVHAVPQRKKQEPPPLQEMTAVVLVRGERCLVRRRPPEGLLAGLWEFPTLTGGDALAASQVSLGEEWAVLHHRFSHLRWKVSVCWGRLQGEPPQGPSWRWATAAELAALPFPAVYHTVVEAVQDRLAQGRSADPAAFWSPRLEKGKHP